MSKAMHTQGPWEFLSEPGYCFQINGADGTVICCFDEDPKPEDARLMATAPELLEALQAMVSLVMREAPHLSGKTIGNAKAVIAKVEVSEAQQTQGGE